MGALTRRLIQAAALLIVLAISILHWKTPTTSTHAALKVTHEPHWGVQLVGPEESDAPTSPMEIQQVPSAEAAASMGTQVSSESPRPTVAAALAKVPAPLQSTPEPQDFGTESQPNASSFTFASQSRLHASEVGSLRAGFPSRTPPLTTDDLPRPWYLAITSSSADRPILAPWMQSFPVKATGSDLALTDPTPLIHVERGLFAGLLGGHSEQVVVIGAEGLAPQAVLLRPGTSHGDAPMQVHLSPGGQLRIQTSPLNKLTLRTPLCTLGNNLPRLQISWVVHADQSGWLELDDLPRDVPLTMTWARANPHAPTQIQCRGEAPVLLNLAQLGGETRLSGTLRDTKGNTLAHTTLWLVPATRKASLYLAPETQPFRKLISDDRGRFQLDNLPAAAWWICPAPDYGWAPVTRWFEVPPGGKEVQLELEALSARTVTGCVVNENDHPVAGATVRLTGEDGKVLAQRLTNGEGGFAFEAPTDAKLTIQIRASGSHSSSELIPCSHSSRPIKLRVQTGGQIQGVFLTAANAISHGPHQVLLHSPSRTPKLFSIDGAFFCLKGLEEGQHGLAVLDTLGQVGTLIASVDTSGSAPATVLLGTGRTTEVSNPTKAPLHCTLTCDGVVWLRTTLAPGMSRTVALPSRPLTVFCGRAGEELLPLHSFDEHAPDHIFLGTGE